MSMLVIVPSRGRPEGLRRFLEAWHETTSSARLLLALDLDDPTLDAYPPRAWEWARYFLPRLGLMPTINKLAMEWDHTFDVIGHMGDDHLPRTPAWDTKIAHALETPGIAYGNDLFQGENLPTAVFMSSSIIRALGHMTCPGVRHFGDVYWKDLGEGAGVLRYLPDVILEHMHPDAQKGDPDCTYAEGGSSSELLHQDRIVWEHYYAQGGLATDIAKIKELSRC